MKIYRQICNVACTIGLLIAFVVVLAVPTEIRAQVVGATLSGTILDSSGAAVPNVNVAIKNTGTGIVRTTVTNDAGFYSAANLQPGVYEVNVSAAGFGSQSATITLTVGAQEALPFSLKVGATSQTVEVTVTDPSINLVDSTLGGLNNEVQIEQLPLNGRSYTDLAALQPGVYTVQNLPSGSTRDRESRGYGSQISISGFRPQQNNYRLDGVSINDPSNSGPGSILGGNLGVDAISEFSILTTNYSTAYGRASGGVVNATTKSGTNQLHGSVYEFLRNSALDAANYFDVQKPPFRRNQFGASVGGPIKKDKLFFFVNYEGLRQDLSLSQNSFVPSVDARNGILTTGNVTVDPQAARFLQTFYPLPNAPGPNADVGAFLFGRPQISKENYFITKIDETISEKDSLHGTYMFDWANTTEADEFNNKLVNNETHNQVLELDETHIFSNKLLNQVRFGVHREYEGAPASATAINKAAADTAFGTIPGDSAAQIQISGLTNFTGGLSAIAPQLDPYISWQAYDDASYVRGIHSMQFGANFEWIRNSRFNTPRPGGQFNFSSIANFLTNQPLTLSADGPNSSTPRDMRDKTLGLYFHDNIRVRSNLTVNVGMRYEPSAVPYEEQGKIQSLLTLTSSAPQGQKLGNPLYANNTLKNFAPRVGFAWDPFKDGKTSVRGGYGIYDQPVVATFFGNPFENSPPFYLSVNAANLVQGDFPTNAYAKGLALIGSGSTLQERIAYVEQHPGRSYVQQYNLDIQRDLSHNLTLLIAYVGSHGVHGITNCDDCNIVQPIVSPVGYLWPCEPFSPTTGCGGIGTGSRVNATVGREPTTLFDDSSVYNGLQTQLTKRMGHGFLIQGSFAWQRSIDTASGNSESDQFLNGISSEYIFRRIQRGPSDFSTPRVLTLNYLWNVPKPSSISGFAGGIVGGWQFGGVFTASSGVPFTPNMAGDTLGLNSTDPWSFPDRLGGPGCQSLVNPGNVQNYLKVQCFNVPPAVIYNGIHYIRLGNAGRNEVYGPGLTNLDVSLVKNTYVKRFSETFNIQFRAEFFNVLNHPNFQVPVDNGQNTILDPTISGIGIVPSNPLTDSISKVPLTSTTTTSRQLQFAIKVIW